VIDSSDWSNEIQPNTKCAPRGRCWSPDRADAIAFEARRDHAGQSGEAHQGQQLAGEHRVDCVVLREGHHMVVTRKSSRTLIAFLRPRHGRVATAFRAATSLRRRRLRRRSRRPELTQHRIEP